MAVKLNSKLESVIQVEIRMKELKTSFTINARPIRIFLRTHILSYLLILLIIITQIKKKRPRINPFLKTIKLKQFPINLKLFIDMHEGQT